MCEYCKGKKPIFEFSEYFDYACIYLDLDELDIDFALEYQTFYGKQKINYCPMCGRKLND